MCREIHRKSYKENFATIRGRHTHLLKYPRPPLPGVLPPSLQRTDPIVAMGERFASDDLYRARALLSPARRHLVRVGSLKFGRLWAMRRRKDDGECCAMMGTATTTATTIYNDIYKNENTIYEDAPRVPLCLLSNKIARKCGV